MWCGGDITLHKYCKFRTRYKTGAWAQFWARPSAVVTRSLHCRHRDLGSCGEAGAGCEGGAGAGAGSGKRRKWEEMRPRHIGHRDCSRSKHVAHVAAWRHGSATLNIVG